MRGSLNSLSRGRERVARRSRRVRGSGAQPVGLSPAFPRENGKGDGDAGKWRDLLRLPLGIGVLPRGPPLIGGFVHAPAGPRRFSRQPAGGRRAPRRAGRSASRRPTIGPTSGSATCSRPKASREKLEGAFRSAVERLGATGADAQCRSPRDDRTRRRQRPDRRRGVQPQDGREPPRRARRATFPGTGGARSDDRQFGRRASRAPGRRDAAPPTITQSETRSTAGSGAPDQTNR